MPSPGRPLPVMSAGRAWPLNHRWSAINSYTSTPTSFCTGKERPGCTVQRQQGLWQRPAAALLLTLNGWISRQQRRLPRGRGLSCGKVSWSSRSGSTPVRPSGGLWRMMSAGWCGCCSSTASRESRRSC